MAKTESYKETYKKGRWSYNRYDACLGSCNQRKEALITGD